MVTPGEGDSGNLRISPNESRQLISKKEDSYSYLHSKLGFLSAQGFFFFNMFLSHAFKTALILKD